jgi:hypothetical protein
MTSKYIKLKMFAQNTPGLYDRVVSSHVSPLNDPVDLPAGSGLHMPIGTGHLPRRRAIFYEFEQVGRRDFCGVGTFLPFEQLRHKPLARLGQGGAGA